MYYMRLSTDLDLCNEQFVRSLIYHWYHHPIAELRPERFGQGEPIRKKFEEEGVESAVKLWLKDKLPLMFKRVTQPKFEVDVSGYQAKKTLTKLFPSTCSVWLNKKAKDKIALELFKFLVKHFRPGFSFITTEKDFKDKHYVEVRDKFGLTQSYVGKEVGEKLPGIYWVTFFSPWAINKIGREKFDKLNVYKIENFQGGLLLTLYEKSSMIGTPEGREIEEEVKAILGKEHFFDKGSFDVR